MKFIVSNNCIKVFSKAVVTGARLADELFFDATDDGLTIQAINKDKTVSYSIFFARNFFAQYEPECVQCKLSSKVL
ncbi:cell cycle checkpoint control protein RAD9A-like isoform X4 [Dinothrombium tinctorium]|uniref:Cell cycle checkpoint control protein RAD9A-like isoform X4 n=1 Tax=Dinothrombium tinctorium TaxID=1965070 RepID=A0A443RKV1_9ACAR|nr:cell cycle checkpoint control protein RAD9A-like isoform X4 [Dinothrombium tinctorium]